MRILHKLLLVGGAVPVLAGAGCLWAYQTLAKARESAAVLSATQALRQEVLLLSLHTDDLVTARQRNDVLAEREAIRLINGATRRTEALLGDIEKGGGRHRLPRAERFDDLRELRDCRELWRLHRDATDEIIRGRAVSRNLEFIHGSAVRLGERLSTMVGGAERRHAACVETGRRVTVATALGVLVLTGIFGWLLHRELLAGFRQASSLMELLSEGTLSPEAELPADGRGEFGGFVRHVNRFLERLRDADRTKDRFLAAMSHEIRTPMNGVIGFLGNLSETPLNEQQRQYLRVIESSARSLLRVINSILDYSKLSAGRMELEEVPFDLARLLEDCTAVTRRLVQGKPVRVVCDCDGLEHPVIRADPTRLRQVLDNLLGNAAKFTERGQIRLHVQARAADEERLHLAFEVEDTGIGIPAEHQAHLFDAFAQADSGTTRKYGGTGLGLCIAASLVRLMGDELTVRSRPGEGSLFAFALKVRMARPEEQVQLSGHYRIVLPAGALRRYWALLVDDTPTNLFLMETICQGIGLPYRTACNGREAVELAQRQRFDLVFMDIQMPVMDGYTAIREIRKLPNSGTTQIIALTASAFAEDVERALGAGSTGFLAKPFERDQLLLCIAQHLDIPAEKELREPVEGGDTREEMLTRQIHDFMREQYQIRLGEIKMILAQTVANWRPLLDDLRVFSRRGDWEEVRAITHRLKGELGSIGLTHFAEVSGDITARIRSGRTESLREEVEAFTEELANAFRIVEKDVTVEPHGTV